MNLTASPAPQPASRLTGLGLAIGVHVILVIGFAGAFVMPKQSKPTETIVKVVKEEPRPPEPIQDPVITKNQIQPTEPTIQQVEQPEWTIAKDPPVAPPTDEGVRTVIGPVVPTITGTVVRAEPKGPLKAGDVCTRMTAPEMPIVNFAGDATFRVVASTHAGHVTSVQIQALSSRIDSRSMRAFKGAIERALGGYECPGAVSFTQEFNFRLE